MTNRSNRPSQAMANPFQPHVHQLAMEFVKAGRRILKERGVYGGERPSALAWLLRLVQDELPDLSQGQLSDRFMEVMSFGMDGVSRDSSLSVEASLPQDPLSFLIKLQSELRGLVNEFLMEGKAELPSLTVKLEVWQSRQGVVVNADLRTSFLYQSAHLLGELGSRVRRCKNCPKIFIAGRTDKRFCSGRCQVSDWHHEHPKESSKRLRSSLTSTKGGSRGTKR